MRLDKIIGDTEHELYLKLCRIRLMLCVCAKMISNKQRARFEDMCLAELHADNGNLLTWVTRSKLVANEYYKIPEQYCK